jgi:hypothetical protein
VEQIFSISFAAFAQHPAGIFWLLFYQEKSNLAERCGNNDGCIL